MQETQELDPTRITSDADLLPQKPVKRKKHTALEGLHLLQDLAAGDDSKRNKLIFRDENPRMTRADREEKLRFLNEDFGISECEVGSMLLTGTRDGWKGVLASLERRVHERKQSRSKKPVS
jgi:hypothetical protein